MIRRSRGAALLAALLVLLAVGVAYAASVGLFFRDSCSTISAPTAYATVCFDQTSRRFAVWNGTAWAAFAPREHDVAAYGGDPTGATDSGSNARAAYNAALSGDTVVFPRGTFLMNPNWATHGIVVPLWKTGVKIKCAGPSATILKVPDGASNYVGIFAADFVKSASETDTSGLEIDDCQWDMNYAGNVLTSVEQLKFGYEYKAGKPTAAITAGGSVTVGDHICSMTFVVGGLETPQGIPTATVTAAPGTQTIRLTVFRIGPPGTTQRNVYCTEAGGSQHKYASAVTNNSDTTVDITIADASLGVNVPTTNGLFYPVDNGHTTRRAPVHTRKCIKCFFRNNHIKDAPRQGFFVAQNAGTGNLGKTEYLEFRSNIIEVTTSSAGFDEDDTTVDLDEADLDPGDTTGILARGRHIKAVNNTFKGLSTRYFMARTALQATGSHVVVEGNTFDAWYRPILVGNAGVSETATSISVTGNVIKNANGCVEFQSRTVQTFTSGPGFRGLTIKGNPCHTDKTTYSRVVSDTDTPFGIRGLDSSASLHFEHLVIEGNPIYNVLWTTDGGHCIDVTDGGAVTSGISSHITVRGNQITNCPRAGINVNPTNFRVWDVSGNTITDPGTRNNGSGSDHALTVTRIHNDGQVRDNVLVDLRTPAQVDSGYRIGGSSGSGVVQMSGNQMRIADTSSAPTIMQIEVSGSNVQVSMDAVGPYWVDPGAAMLYGSEFKDTTNGATYRQIGVPTGRIWQVTDLALTPAVISSNQNNYNPWSGANIFHIALRVSCDASGREIRGLGSSGTVAGGRTHVITNVGQFDCRIMEEHASATAQLRFLTGVGGIRLTPMMSVAVTYDSAASGPTGTGTLGRWRVLNPQPGMIASASATGLNVTAYGGARTHVAAYTVGTAHCTAASAVCNLTVATLPPRTFLKRVFAAIATPFTCDADCATVNFAVGTSTGSNSLLATLSLTAAANTIYGDIDAELGATINAANRAASGPSILLSWTANTTVSLQIICAGGGTGNCGDGAATNLTAGSVEVFLETSLFPGGS